MSDSNDVCQYHRHAIRMCITSTSDIKHRCPEIHWQKVNTFWYTDKQCYSIHSDTLTHNHGKKPTNGDIVTHTDKSQTSMTLTSNITQTYPYSQWQEDLKFKHSTSTQEMTFLEHNCKRQKIQQTPMYWTLKHAPNSDIPISQSNIMPPRPSLAQILQRNSHFTISQSQTVRKSILLHAEYTAKKYQNLEI